MASQPNLRPSLSRHHSRVPGGFETDDEFSPIKTEFDYSLPRHDSEHDDSLSSEQARSDSSVLYAPRDEGKSHGEAEEEADAGTLDETEMKRRLLELDSTFLPDRSYPGPEVRSGEDDAYVFGNPRDIAKHSRNTSRSTNGYQSFQEVEESDNNRSPETPPEAYQTPAPKREYDLPSNSDERYSEHNATASLETMSSSPTAAAAARTVSRVVSLASMGGYETADEQAQSYPADTNNGKLGKAEENIDMTPGKDKPVLQLPSEPTSPTPTKPLGDNVQEAEGIAIDPDEPLKSSKSPRKRPSALRSRFASQRSSYSSYTSYTSTSTDLAGGSDLTLGADYALQTGGTIPFGGSITSRPVDLSRSASLGSMASGISAFRDGEDALEGMSNSENLDPLLEEDDTITRYRVARGRSEDPSVLHTPRATSRNLETPTDTIIAQRIGDFGVPGTVVARRLQAGSPDRKNGLVSSANNRSTKHMTLKEQSDFIDKIQKQNWDLKLRITHLDASLNQRSEEGTKAMISENVELKSWKFTAQKEIRYLKRSVRELEARLKERDERIVELKDAQDSKGQQELQAEVAFLRERVSTYEREVETLRQETVERVNEKRRLAEVVKSLSERRSGESDIGVREEVDMWKDLLEAESSRREQADEENRKLREEVWKLKADAVSNLSTNNGPNGLTAEKRRQLSSGYPQVNGVKDTDATSSALVEQLRHENAELRREVGAQTSMLTSRNREKERLYQEIEDLKMNRGTRSVAGDSILERSASRAHGRPASRMSDITRTTQMSDAERELYENKTGELRDQISELKLKNQDFAAQLDDVLYECEQHVLKAEFDKMKQLYEDMIDQNEQDLQVMQAERDEALKLQDEAERSFQGLREEAQLRIDEMEEELEQKGDLLARLEAELQARDAESSSLRNEVRMMGEGLKHVEEDVQTKVRRIQEIELENEDINRELESLEKSLIEANGKAEKLQIELESRQGECAFLREEQDGYMLRIGDLETELKTARTGLGSEKERVKDLETRLADERHQREVVGSKEKQEVQKIMNDLNREATNSKEESRKLKKSVETREIEIKTYKERLTELEEGLREVLGDSNGTKSNFYAAIAKLQTNLHTTSTELANLKNTLSEKDRLLQKRDALLESHGLESRKLSDLLEKERQGRRADKTQHEQWQKTHQHTSRTVSQKDTRITELEAARQTDRKKLTTLEQQYKDQLTERNNLLLALWSRLSALCGTDWQHQNSIVSGHLPTLEVVAGMLPAFSKNLLLAVKTIEGLLGGFKARIRGIERDFVKEFQALEHNLDMRIKRLDRLESAVQVNRVSQVASATPELAKLRGENRLLKSELAALQKQESVARAVSRSASTASASNHGHPALDPSVTNNSSHRASLSQSLQRHHSASVVESITRANSHPSNISSLPSQNSNHQQQISTSQAQAQALAAATSAITLQSPNSQAQEPSQQRWIHRLRELERRLKAEREARLLDRSGARKRLEERDQVNEELKMELERQRIRAGAEVSLNGSGGGQQQAGQMGQAGTL